jgi:transcriptional regulator with XRE-family HTH domain
MNVEWLLRGARGRRTLRELAERAHTSHATISAYEAGRVAPTTDTFERVVRAAGFEVEPSLVRTLAVADRAERGRELVEVLDLAAQFPARHHPTLRCPVFGAT